MLKDSPTLDVLNHCENVVQIYVIYAQYHGAGSLITFFYEGKYTFDLNNRHYAADKPIAKWARASQHVLLA